MGIGHETNLERESDIREQRWSVLILTNGATTEVAYFSGVKEHGLAGEGKVLTVRFHNSAPRGLVQRAAVLRDYSEYDEAWAVCDVDEFEVHAAIAAATANNINIALSQPSFEIWLILHKSNQCPGFNTADQAGGFLSNYVTNWDKTRLNFADFIGGIRDAIERAQRLGEPPGNNPSTSVWRLAVSLGIGENLDSEPVQEILIPE